MRARLIDKVIVVPENSNYIVFSPYTRKFLNLTRKELRYIQFKSNLKELGLLPEIRNYNQESNKIQNLGFTITSNCNLNCKYCYNDGNENIEMEPQLALKILNSVVSPKSQYLLISFFGGEPTLKMDTIIEVVNHVKDTRIPTHFHITTNGLICDEYLDFMIENDFDITVSLDGIAEINNFLRPYKDGSPTTNSVIRTIKRLSKEKALFQIRSTILPYNVRDMASFIDFVDDMGVKYVHFEPISIDGRAKKNGFDLPSSIVFIEEFKRMLDKAEEKRKLIISSLYMNLITPSEYFCTSIHGDKLLFNPDGSVSICYKVQSAYEDMNDFIIGAYDEDKEKLFIDEKKRKEWSRFTVQNYNECDKCFAKYICGGGCPQRNFLSTGKCNLLDKWMCIVKKDLLKDAILRLYKDSKRGLVSTTLGAYLYEREILKKLKREN